ncbi:MAG: hypothetical protein JJE04_17275 [Acidobacteriia bacterium]|nr:hypothetical protein [Terriglobia bacterium]
MLTDLRQEREQIEEAITTLERLASGRGKRRGRPPLWLAEAKKRTDAQTRTALPAGKLKTNSAAAKASAN